MEEYENGLACSLLRAGVIDWNLVCVCVCGGGGGQYCVMFLIFS